MRARWAAVGVPASGSLPSRRRKSAETARDSEHARYAARRCRPLPLHRSTGSPAVTPISFTEAEIDAVAFDADGLVPAIVQEEATGQVLMVGVDERGRARAGPSRPAAPGSGAGAARSTGARARRPATASTCASAYYDCDMDVLLFVVEQEGRGACHTGERSCFFRAFGGGADARARVSDRDASSRRSTSSARSRASTPSSRSGARCSPTSRRRCRPSSSSSATARASCSSRWSTRERWGRFSFIGRDPALTLVVRGQPGRGDRRASPPASRSIAARSPRSRRCCTRYRAPQPRRAAAVPRRHRRLARLRHRARDRAPARRSRRPARLARRGAVRSPVTSPRSTTSASGSS